jgi:predicted unusual protein kinase regulating ubiquinone biosynthesis (AarF/ABC1/UbiB family)
MTPAASGQAVSRGARGPENRENGLVTDIPRRAVTRTARLASLPVGVAGRAALGFGKRLGGRPAVEVTEELQRRTAEQLFAVLGQLKGGAMKFGQALSVFEAAVPDELAGPFRESLTKLQHAAPPMATREMHRMLAEQFGRNWRERFREFDDVPAAAASIGQVHRAVWHDGREVAVKVQYPGAEEALRSDLRQLARFSRLLQPLAPGTDVKPLVAELRDRMEEELDYRDEAANQRAFAEVFADDEKIMVPRVVASAPRAMVSEWVTGRKLSEIISAGTPEERDQAGALLAEFHYSAPARARLLHADPHPGNFQILPDGRLLVLDFGAVARLPEGLPRPLSVMTRLALENRPDDLVALLRREGFLLPGTDLTGVDLVAYLAPFAEPLRSETFHFTRRWMQSQAERVGDVRSPNFDVGRRLNLPPQYLLVHRVSMGTLGVLCQLDTHIALRDIVARWNPATLADV